MNKLLSKICTGAIAVMLVGSLGIQAKANNYQDTYYTASLDDYYGITEDYTPGRYKADYSKGYVNNIRSSYNGATVFTLVACDGDESYNHFEDFKLYKYYISPGESSYLTNLVKENGYNYASVKIEPGSDYYMETYFAWSPDNYAGY